MKEKSHYSLEEAADLLHRKPMDLIHMAVHEQITLLVGVPDNVSFRTYDAAADVTESPALLEPQLLALLQSHCLKIELNGKTEQSDFREGYLINPAGALQKLLPSYGRPSLNHLWAFWRTYDGSCVKKIELVPERLFVVGSDLRDLQNPIPKIEQIEKTSKSSDETMVEPILKCKPGSASKSDDGFEKSVLQSKPIKSQEDTKLERPLAISTASNNSNPVAHKPLTIIRLKSLQERTGLSRSTIYDKMNAKSPRFDSTFPKQVNLGVGSVGWYESEVDTWLESRRK